VKLGIDFGTTRTLVATSDRGNYPVVSFTDEDGEAHEHVPSMVADVGGKLVYGLDAARALRAGAPALRSMKRLLSRPDAHADLPVRIGAVEIGTLALLGGFAAALKDALLRRSNAPRKRGDTALDAVIAVPANALSGARFLTLEAFRRAGFAVKGMLNEPSAAGFEYTHRQPSTVTSRRTRVLVYDLGGGTFDASLVRVDGEHHDVLATAGDPLLGGDDFDAALLRMALDAAGLGERALAEGERLLLLEQCREAKERILPQSKRITLDLSAIGGPASVAVPVEAYYDAVAPLVECSLEAMRPLVPRLDDESLAEVAGIYLVGGGSGLPVVARMLRERFGRRVHRSPYPAASTAIGLAIAADDGATFSLRDRFGRGFGVFRERGGGHGVTFDAIVGPDVPVPSEGTLEIRRRYRAAHNVGHFRFVECRGVGAHGEPQGDVAPFGEIWFPFDPSLRGKDLRAAAVERREGGPEIEEIYALDATGLVAVRIRDLASGYEEAFRLQA
jgi:molecular chaperone DnaK (HSP70)